MTAEFLLLLAPSASRVYAADAPGLAAQELALTAPFLTGPPQVVRIAGVDYLGFTADEPDLKVVSALSSRYALYHRDGDLLRPVELPSRDSFPDDLVTIPKYNGKTNEQFTKLLLNVTVAIAGASGRATVLDPVCGRGTTLSHCVLAGYRAIGIDIGRKDVDYYAQFVGTWSKTHRLPHTVAYGPLREHGKVVAQRLVWDVFADRSAQKAGRGGHVEVFCADTRSAADLVRPGTVDAIVADLPYGVQHGSHHGDGRHRRAGDLLREALLPWRSCLRPGGAIGLAYNAKTLRPDELSGLLTDAGFDLRTGPDAFRHRVDASIDRRIALAVR